MNKFIRVAVVLAALALVATVPPGYCQTPTWQPTAGPEGGFITGLVINSQGHLFAAVRRAGVFRSTDRGENWTEKNSGIGADIYNLGLGYSPQSDSLFVSQSAWIYRSTDDGESWQATFQVDTTTIVARSDGLLMAGTWDRGVMRSTDDGVTWQQVGEGVLPPWVTSLGFDSDGHVYAGARPGVFVSENDGDTWSLVPGSENFEVTALGVDPSDQDVHVAAYNGGRENVPNDGSTYRYDVVAQAWCRTAPYGTDPAGDYWGFYYVTAFAFDGRGAIYISTVQNSGVSRSLDHGLTWEYIGLGRDQFAGGGGLRSIWAVAVSSDGTVFAGWSGDGVFKWTGTGLEWIRFVNGMPASNVLSLLVARDGAVLAGTSAIGILRSPDRGGTWQQLRSDWINECASVATLAMNSKGQIFATLSWEVLRSDDGGITWPSPYDGTTIIPRGNSAYALAIGPGDVVYVGGGANFLRSRNDGVSWDILSGLAGADIRALAVDAEGRVFAGTLNNGSYSGLYRSEDGGESWQQVGFSGTYWVRSIAINPVNGDIFVGLFGSLYRSSDHGNTWTELPPQQVTAIAINAEGRIFAGGYGVETSTDNGATWQPFDDGLRSMFVWSLAFDADGYLYAGEEGGGGSRTTETTLRRPVAHAGPDQTVECSSPTGTQVTLDGSASSDPSGHTLTYTWTGPFPEGGGTITGVNPTVTLPIGPSTVTLVVNDGYVDSAPDTTNVSVTVRVQGFLAPLASLVPEGDPVQLPDKAFKQGRTLPLTLELFCGGTPCCGPTVAAPRIVGLQRSGEALDLEALDLDSGQTSDGGLDFRATGSSWMYNLKTKGLVSGTYVITVQMPDTRRWVSGFVLR
jgi:photosystem II stability/assembly factor-like uncharacterized protein